MQYLSRSVRDSALGATGTSIALPTYLEELSTQLPAQGQPMSNNRGAGSSLVFVDAALLEQNPSLFEAASGEVHVLSGDGMAQISQVLAGRSGIDSVQIFSHGQSGSLTLGTTTLTSETLGQYQAALHQWQSAFSADADILLYGCNVAADALGQGFVNEFARLTATDIAASVDLTGAARLGGDWDLEYATGSIEATNQLRPWLEANVDQVWLTFNYGNFASVSGLQLNGNAAGVSNALRLTPAVNNQRGSSFYTTPVAVNTGTSFSSQFQFRLSGGTNGADGLAFVIQGGAATALGSGGGGVGYAGLGNSLAIEFDTYQNAGDPNNNHISLLRNGSTTALANANSPVDLNGGQLVNVWVEYNGSSDRLDVYLSNGAVKPTAATLSATVDLAATVGSQAYVGFSAATGGLNNAHEVTSWKFSDVAPVNGTGDGLSGQYYDNINFTGTSITRVDPQVNFNWGLGSPDSRIQPDTFSARWSGQVQPRYTDDYTFFTTADDGVRLFVNNQLVIDQYRDQPPTTFNSTPIRLQAGQRYDIRMEYYENGGGAVAQLGWTSPNQTREFIPQSQLYSSGGQTLISLGQGATSVSESAGFVDIPILRSGPLTGSSTIDVRTLDGTAVGGTGTAGDYGSVSQTVTFNPGEASKTVRIAIRDDQVAEGNEVFNFNIDNPQGAGIGAPRTVQVTINDNDATGTGLLGEYFDDRNFSVPSFIRTDGTVNFNWGTGSPDPRIQPDTFSVRWSGKIQPRFSEEYTFFTTTDDGVRLFVNDQLVVNQFVDQASTEASGRITLQAGQLYNIRMEYYENGGDASASLAWSSASQAKQIIPASQLFASTTEAPVFEFSQTKFTAGESAGNGTVTVTRNATSSGNAASVTFSTANLSATAGSDYSAVSQGVSFAPGETTKQVSIPILTDTAIEWNERVQLNLTNPSGGGSISSTRGSAVLEIADDDSGVTRQVLTGGFTQPTQMIWVPGSSTRSLVAEKAGKVRLVNNGVIGADVIDISTETNIANDRGLLSIALHPDFNAGSPYLYLLYSYDFPETAGRTGLAGPDGGGNRPSRLMRVTLDPNTLQEVAGSRTIILGRNSNAQNTSFTSDGTADINGPESGLNPDGSFVQDYLVTDSNSHGIGQLRFAPDKSLFITNGDGASYNAPDPRADRTLDVNSLSGKMLRINPLTGAGYADNPFATGNLNANASKVWSLGLRNPFRFAFKPGTNDAYIGDVGWNTWEEINLGRGQNFGWPAYEGGNTGSALNGQYQNFSSIQAFLNGPNNQVKAPELGLNHTDDQIAALVMGDFYTGTTSLPSLYNNALFYSSLRVGSSGTLGTTVFAVQLDAAGKVVSTKRLLDDEPTAGFSRIVNMQMGPDGQLYYVNLDKGEIGRLRTA
jgi:glucose/arabinose dehydrogenase